MALISQSSTSATAAAPRTGRSSGGFGAPLSDLENIRLPRILSETISAGVGLAIKSSQLAQSPAQPQEVGQWWGKLLRDNWRGVANCFLANWCFSTPAAYFIGQMCERTSASAPIAYGLGWLVPTVVWHASFAALNFVSSDLKPMLQQPKGERLGYLKRTAHKYLKLSAFVEASWLTGMMTAQFFLIHAGKMSYSAAASCANFGLAPLFNLLLVPAYMSALESGAGKVTRELAGSASWSAKKYSLGLLGAVMTRLGVRESAAKRDSAK